MAMAGAREPPLVTVVIATFDRSVVLKCALRSLRNQDFEHFEAWIVGDACSDDSEEVVASFKDERFFWTNLPKNSGSQSIPNNEGIRRARGRYIAYLGHDDLWMPWHLSGLVAHMEKTGADLVHSLAAMIGRHGARSAHGAPPDGKIYQHNHIAPSSMMHRREMVEHSGFWRDASKISRQVDYDFILRAVKAGISINYCPQLSVIKFLAGEWNLYSRKTDFPQVSFIEELLQDAASFHKRILIEIAADVAKNKFAGITIKQAVKSRYHSVKGSIFSAYGRDRWPLSVILFMRYQRNRKIARRARGLKS